MRYLKQFGIILVISFLGEICHAVIPLPIPASIYGIILMFGGLKCRWIPLESVKDTGTFLIEIMPVMFIPAAVGILESWGLLKPFWIQYVVITVVSTCAVMAVSGCVTQIVMRRKKGRERNE